MTIVKWLLLIIVILIVIGAYLYIRRASGDNPWHDMEERPSGQQGSTNEAGDTLQSDSYIVGIRKIANETPRDRKAATQKKARQQDAWDEEPPLDRTRAVNQPTAVKRTRPASKKTAPQKAKTDQTETKQKQKKEKAAKAAETKAETVTNNEAAASESDHIQTEIPLGATERVEMVAPRRTENSQIFQLYVVADEGQQFQGPDIQRALRGAGLKFGLHDLYHRVTEVHGVTESVFCVANMLNPGTLDPIDQDHLTTTGLAMFLLVPAPIEGRKALTDMMETANRLTGELGGQVLDDNRSRLKQQTAQYMFDQVADIERRAKLAQQR